MMGWTMSRRVWSTGTMEDQHAVLDSDAQSEALLTERLATMQVFGLTELASRWSVSKQRADEIATKRLGEPWRTLRMGRIWSEKQVTDFEAGWVRKTGRHIVQ